MPPTRLDVFKVIRIFLLLTVLLFVSLSTYLTQARSTDWNNSLYVKIYPISADDSATVARYIARLERDTFTGIEDFVQREARRFGHQIDRPVRIRLGQEIGEQPPSLDGERSRLDVMWWSLRMRWWARSVASPQDEITPDVRIFVRYHAPAEHIVLESSVGLQKGMVGIVNAYASRRQAGANNVIIAHEFLHTLGATDKYDPSDGTPEFPDGYAEPERRPLHPQRKAEIMGGRIAVSELEANMPKNLQHAVIGDKTAEEIRLR